MSEDNKQVLKPVKIVKVKVKASEAKKETSQAVVPKQIKKAQLKEPRVLSRKEAANPVSRPQPARKPAVPNPQAQKQPKEDIPETRIDTRQPIQNGREQPVLAKVPLYNRWWFWLILAAAILGLVALMTRGNSGGETNGTDTTGASNSNAAVEITTENSDSINVDENLLTVEVTMPAAFFENETPEEIQASAKESGFLSCTVNEDGSVTYKMTKGKRAEILRSFKGEIDSTIQEYLSGGENAPQSYRKITYNDKVTQFDVRVDRAAYENSWTDAFYMMGFYILGGYYQIVDGVPNDQVDVIVNIIDDATGETIETGSYKNFISNTQA